MKKIRKQAIELMKTELNTLFKVVRPSMKTAEANNLFYEIFHADKLNVLDRIKRDLNKFKAVSATTNGAKLFKNDLKEALKEQRLVEEKERIKTVKPREKRQYFCSGTFTVETEYNYKNKKGIRLNKKYEDPFKNAKVIEAYTEKEAEDAFIEWGTMNIPNPILIIKRKQKESHVLLVYQLKVLMILIKRLKLICI